MLKIGELEYRISRLEKSSSASNVLGGNVKNQVEKCVLAGASTPASGQGSGNPDQINLTSGGITRPSQCIKEIPVDMDFLENGCLGKLKRRYNFLLSNLRYNINWNATSQRTSKGKATSTYSRRKH